jgi:hypothetical protein
MSSLRPEIEDRRPTWSAWRKAESHGHEFDLVPRGAHHRSGVVDPDVVGLRQIEIALSARNSKLQSLHHFAVIGPTDVLLIIVTHLANVRSVSG